MTAPSIGLNEVDDCHDATESIKAPTLAPRVRPAKLRAIQMPQRQHEESS